MAILLITAATACKKKAEENVPTYLSLFVGTDSAWAITNVETYTESSGLITITANNNALFETIKLGLKDYREGRKVYNIGTGGTINYGSTASYKYNGKLEQANSGTIEVTNMTTKTMEGTYDFRNNFIRVFGKFIAKKP